MSELLVPSKCCCIRSKRTGELLGLCSHCRARLDPVFAKTCVPPVKARKVRKAKKR